MLKSTCQRTGVYVRAVYPSSFFPLIKEGDILLEIAYSGLDGKIVRGSIDQFGDISVCQTITSNEQSKDERENQSKEQSSICYLPGGEDNGQRVAGERKSIKEFLDDVPVDGRIEAKICRDGQIYYSPSTFSHVPSTIRDQKYLYYEPMQYEIFCGMCITPLTSNHINSRSPTHILKYLKGKLRYTEALVVTHIFSGTTAGKVDIIEVMDIVAKVNDVKVATIDDLRRAIAAVGDLIIIKSKDKKKFVIERNRAVSEDLAVVREQQLTNYQYKLTKQKKQI